jgi:5'-nucleotidase
MSQEASGPGAWVLLTNDDGPDSPALAPLARALLGVAPVRALVPARECSWTGKILSRFGRLALREHQRGGLPLWTLDGYPADCANVGVHHLAEAPPALVVSGVNVGANAGLAYFLSSGTVGAAVEAYLSGVPAMAVSLQLRATDFARWREHRDLDDLGELWAGAATVAAEIAAEVLAGGLPGGAHLLSVNLPPDATPATPRRFAGVTATRYGSFFRPGREAGTFEYGHTDLVVDPLDAAGDVAVLARGEVAITAVRFGLDLTPTAADRRRFERDHRSM